MKLKYCPQNQLNLVVFTSLPRYLGYSRIKIPTLYLFPLIKEDSRCKFHPHPIIKQQHTDYQNCNKDFITKISSHTASAPQSKMTEPSPFVFISLLLKKPESFSYAAFKRFNGSCQTHTLGE